MAVAAQRLERTLPGPPRLFSSPARRVKRVPFILFSLGVIASMLLALVTAQTLVTQNSFRIAEMSERAQELEGEYGRLRLRVAELSSPERLVRAARKAGMVLPTEVQIVPVPPMREKPRPMRGRTLALKGLLGGSG